MSLSDGLVIDEHGTARCAWGGSHPLYVPYHDTEWGYPVTDDARLFEKICLEGFQSGLSWLTILKKRPAFRAAFADFDIDAVAAMGQADVERLLSDAGIVRHRGKIEATLNNARRAVELRDDAGSLAAYFWRWEPPRRTTPVDLATLRGLSRTAQSTALSKDLKKRGWRFVGPTTAYAFMQAMGLVNDHLAGCTVHDRVEAAAAAFERPG
ncbi:MAG: DNA-3-methyladenine glycosylase I [Oligoflexia bacterium]|nr:DNA-3-methyladenine glycosylase I [Oligoflexia bacterium]